MSIPNRHGQLAALKRYIKFSNFNRGSQTLNAVKNPTIWHLFGTRNLKPPALLFKSYGRQIWREKRHLEMAPAYAAVLAAAGTRVEKGRRAPLGAARLSGAQP